MNTKLLPILLIGFCSIASAQEKEKDSIVGERLSEVVVTAQFEPQSVKKSVFNVRVITAADIRQLAANNLGDVLNQYINITVRPSGSDGRSTVSMFGLDGQYFKTLMDNIPMVSDSGLGNNIDLTQINLDDVERIEIIEGSMGVTHGANAVSGILNIITKKTARHKWNINASVQEETVGDEYALFDKGRHIQSLKVSHKITDHWFASVGANRNDLTGFLGDRKGKEYTVNDGRRGYSWLPKEQWVSNLMLSYTRDRFRFFYKFDYLNETIDFYDDAVSTSPPPFLEKYSADKRYLTDRFYHHLNVDGQVFGHLQYNASLSHQKQSREKESFDYYIESDSERDKSSITDQSSEVLYSTGTLGNFFENTKADFQLGYEITSNNGSAFVDRANGFEGLVRKRIENYDAFASGEYKVTEKLTLRSGFRYSFQSLFDNQYAASAGLRYLFGNGIEARASFGKSFRTPNFDELYSEFIIPSHTFLGNENLIPERSTSYEASIKKQTTFSNTLQLVNDITVSHIDVKDKITSAIIDFGPPTVINQYININSYRMFNVASTNQLRYNDLTFNAGISIVGISQEIDNGEAVSDDKFLYTFNMNSSVSYNVSKWKTIFSLYYKYTGREQNFYGTTDENGDPTFKLGKVSPYSWMDASIRKSFYKDRFDLTVGARNLLDVTNVRQTTPNAGTAHPTSGEIMLGYGRSYYMKLTYNLNF